MHGMDPLDEIDYWRERAERAERLLTDEDKRALAWARGFISTSVPEHRDPACYPMLALAALDKLLTRKGGG